MFCTQSDSGQRKYIMTVAGRQLEAFPSLLENLDLCYKVCWVFNIRYLSSVELIYKFLEYSVYKQREGRVPNCIVELLSVLSSPKLKNIWSLCVTKWAILVACLISLKRRWIELCIWVKFYVEYNSLSLSLNEIA